MKRNKIFQICLVLLGVVATFASMGYGNSVTKQAEPLIDQVEALVTNPVDVNAGISDALGIVHRAAPNKSDVLIPWLKQKEGILPAPFTMELGYRIFPKNHAEGLRWYVLGRVRAVYDYERCADPTAAGAIPILIGEYRQIPLYGSTHLKAYLTAWQQALDWEQTHPYTATPIWLCAHGLEPHLRPEKEWPEIRAKVLEESRTTLKKHLEELNKPSN